MASDLAFIRSPKFLYDSIMLRCFRLPVIALLLIITNQGARADKVQIERLPASMIQQRLENFAGNDSQREATLKRMFTEAGCEKIVEQPVKGLKQPNLICVVAGTDAATIVVGAHFDHVSAGAGVVDNWSGAALLPSLLQSLNHQPRRHTFIFIAFAGEEQGLIGSSYYVRHLLPGQKSAIEAMVNMDTLGLGPPEVWASHADPKLVALLAGVAKELSIPLSAVNVDNVGSTDSESFRDKKIPAITVHSLTSQSLGILHSHRDQLSQIKLDDYYRSYELVAAFLAVLDADWPLPAKPH